MKEPGNACTCTYRMVPVRFRTQRTLSLILALPSGIPSGGAKPQNPTVGRGRFRRTSSLPPRYLVSRSSVQPGRAKSRGVRLDRYRDAPNTRAFSTGTSITTSFSLKITTGLSASCARVTNARARSRVAALPLVNSQSNGSTATSDSSRAVSSKSEVPTSR